jgi:hypothetical protein
MAWQPIKTAPRDGTRILVLDGPWDTNPCVVQWVDDGWVTNWNGEPYEDCEAWHELPAIPDDLWEGI